MNQGNQWAYLTDVNIHRDFIDVQAWGESQSTKIAGLSQIEFRGIAPATPEILKAMHRWMDKPPQFPFYQEEWMCLYCGSPVPLPDRHCTQCGAPRNWLIG